MVCVVCVDARIAFKGAVEGNIESAKDQDLFWKLLAHDLISNNYDSVGLRERSENAVGRESQSYGNAGPSGVDDIHLKTIKRRKKNLNGGLHQQPHVGAV